MPQYPLVGGGSAVDDQFLSDMIDNYVIKPADSTPRVVTTIINDPDLTFPVVANAVYDVLFHVRFGALQTAGIRTAWTVPAGTSGNRVSSGPGSANAIDANGNITELRWAVNSYAAVVNYTSPRNAVASPVFLEEKAIVAVGSTAGAVTFQWGQTTANATGTVVTATSYVKYRRIG